MIGTTLSTFKITGKLGEGGMGEVWRAEDTKLGRQVALKLLPEDFDHDPDRHSRFEREARVLASLNHTNIATLYGLEHLDGRHALIMELVEGVDLSQRIEEGPVPAEEAVAIALQVAEALEAAHEQGIVHRDLKPANIKLCPDGAVKVLDFGLAKAWTSEEDDRSLSLSPTLTRNATAAGVILGTAAYMSPEQARGKPADRRADIWAFGVVLWEMLTGSATYQGETITDIIAAVITREPSWQQLPEATPQRLGALLRRCLEKEPRQRLQAIGEARIELEALAAGRGDEPMPPGESLDQPKSGRLWQAAAVVLLLTTLVAGGFAIRRDPAPQRVFKAAMPLPDGTAFSLDQSSPGPVAVSPDGRKLTFAVIDENGKIMLWIREVGETDAKLLNGTDGAIYPFWSPDSRQIGFFTGDGKLRRIDAAGGPPVTICEASNGKGASWNREDQILFTPSHNSPIFIVPAAGGEPRELTALAEGVSSHRFPHWLPDGRFLYLSRSASGVDNDRIHLASLQDPTSSKELLGASSNVAVTPGHLLFLREGTLMAQPFDEAEAELTGDATPVVDDVLYLAGARWGLFSASRDGLLVYLKGNVQTESELVWLDRNGRELSQLGGGVFHRDVALSKDGAFAVVEIIDEVAGASDLWIYNVTRGLRTRFTFSPEMEWFPAWAPDGSEIAYATNAGGRLNILRKDTGGTEAEEQVLKMEDADIAPEAWSPDGRWLLFVQALNFTNFDILSLPLDGGDPVPVAATSFNESLPALSPDGRWLAFASDESGRSEVYVTSFPEPTRRWQMSTDGGTCPRWSHDGSELYVLGPDGALLAVEVTSADDSLSVGSTTRLFSWSSPPTVRHSYDVDPDGRFLVNRSSGASQTSPMTVVLNWQEDLR